MELNDKIDNSSTFNFKNQIYPRNIISDNTMKEEQKLVSQIRKLEARRSTWFDEGVRKSKSPCILAELGESLVCAVIDEGSEINCVDEGFAVKHGMKYVATSCKATAAGCNVMSLAGQTEKDISIKIRYSTKSIVLRLGRMIVVKNLGVEILVGEPGKEDNEIVTIPHKKLIEFSNDEKKRVRLPYSFKSELRKRVQHFTVRLLQAKLFTLTNISNYNYLWVGEKINT